MAITPLQVIKYFMAALDQTSKKGTKALDEAVKACSKFDDVQAVINKMLQDRNDYIGADLNNGDIKFLKEKCGIILDNNDTGAITGSDASGGGVKNAENIVPENSKKSWTYPTENNFTVGGVKFILPSTIKDDADGKAQDKKVIIGSMYTWWAEEVLKLIENSLGYSFNDADATFTEINIKFSKNPPDPDWIAWSNSNTHTLTFNMNIFSGITKDNVNGIVKDSDGKNQFLDRTLAHEMTHLIMGAKIKNYDDLPSFINEGLCELVHGIDDEKPNSIGQLAAWSNYLKNYLNLNTTEDEGSYTYAAGYMFFRYLAKQASSSYAPVKSTLTYSASSDNISNSQIGIVVNGAGGDDTIQNSGGYSTINGGAGNDSLKNNGANHVVIKGDVGADSILSYGSNITVDSGADADYVLIYNDSANVSVNAGNGTNSIYSGGKNIKITAGKDADYIYLYNPSDNVSVNAGNGKNTIESGGKNIILNSGSDSDNILLYTSSEKVYVNPGKGNDSIKTYSTLGNVFQYANGDGNDTITGISAKDTIKITGAEYEKVTLSSSKNVTLKVGSGSLILEDAKNISFKIDGKEKVSNIISLTSGNDNTVNSASGKTIYALAGKDTVKNTANNVTIDGGNNEDRIVNNGGNTVSIFGGAGNDNLYNDKGTKVTLEGGAGADYISNWDSYAKISGGDSNDTIYNNEGTNTTVDGGVGADYISNWDSRASISGGAGNDSLYTYGGTNSTIIGGKDNDYILLSNLSKNNVIVYNSGDGKDTITGISAKDTIKITGAEYEKVTLSSSKDVTLKVGSGSLILKDAKNISFKIDGKEKVSNIISLTSGNDTTVNSASGKIIYALAGKDNIENKGANVTIYGGAGNDSILNRQSNVLIYGENDADSVINASTNVTVYGGAANDTLENHSASKGSTIHGDAGNDVIKNNGTKAVLYGDVGNDIISLGSYSQNATIIGGAGNDSVTLYGGGNVVQYSNGDGKDVITGFSTTDTLYIASGTVSKVSISGNDAFLTIGSGSVNLKAVKGKTVKLKNSSGIVTETIFGGEILPAGISIKNSILTASSSFTENKIDLASYKDASKVDASALSKAVSIVGSSAANSLKGGKGADTISGGAGNDTVSLGGGNDIYIYASGNDLIQDYTAGQDKIKLTGTSITSSSLSGSNIILKTSNGNITVKNGKNKKITVIDSSGKETSNIYPLDTLPAGISIKNSILTASSSFTGNKIDLANYSGVTKVNASALTKDVEIIGNSYANSIKGGKGIDTIRGGGGNDSIDGGNGDNFLYGNAGDDKISGGAGIDILYGGAGNDSLNGGAGSDFLVGGEGTNTLTGGANVDVFYISEGKNYITDYKAGEDCLYIENASVTSYSCQSSNLILNISTGSQATIKGGKNKNITIIDSKNKVITKTYSQTFDLFEDNNFISNVPEISDITEKKFTVTQIQTQPENYNSLAQDDRIFLTHADK